MQSLFPSTHSGPASAPDKETPEVLPNNPPPQEDDGDIETAPFEPETQPCRGPDGPGPETCRERVGLFAALKPPPRD